MRSDQNVMQLCMGYNPPFLDCARQYASAIKSAGYKVTTVYLTGEPCEQVAKDSVSDEVVFLNFKGKQLRGLKLCAINRVRKLVKQKTYQFFLAHRSKPTYIALFSSSIPVISVHHAFGDYQRGSRRLLANTFKSRLYFLGVSNAVRDDLRRSFPSWPVMKIQTQYNCIDVNAVKASMLDKRSARNQLGLPQDVVVIGNVGRLHPDKDQSTLIKGFAAALQGLPSESLLVIMGQGPLESDLKDLAVRLGVSDRVRFLGQIPRASRYFKAFDVFALTSDHEPFGMVLLEAMAADIPIICTDAGGGKEVVEGCGKLFPLGDHLSLAESILKTLDTGTPHLQDGLRLQSKRLQDKFSDSASQRAFCSVPFISQLGVIARDVI